MGVILDLCGDLERLKKLDDKVGKGDTFGSIFARKFGQKPVVGSGQHLHNESILYTM